MYDLDLFDTPASTVATLHGQGRRVTCYIDAGSYEPGRPDSGSFPASVLGSGLEGAYDATAAASTHVGTCTTPPIGAKEHGGVRPSSRLLDRARRDGA